MTDDELRRAHSLFIAGNAPPHWVVERARQAAMRSPCAKSKRGVALYRPELEHERISALGIEPGATGPDEGMIFSGTAAYICPVDVDAFNGPPEPFVCDGSDACKLSCPKICMHAEARAIARAAAMDTLDDYDLVHVKVVGDKVVPGGGPQCWQCSRLVVEHNVSGVWLLEGDPGSEGKWTFYSAVDFHEDTAKHPRNMLHVVR